MPDKPPTANEITDEMIRRISQELPRIWIYRSNRLNAPAIGRGGKKIRLSAGIDGQGDLTAVIGRHPDCECESRPPVTGEIFTCPAPYHLRGQRYDLEVKADYTSGRDRQSPIQEAFEIKLKFHGGEYLLVERIGWLNGKPDLSVLINSLRDAIGS